MRGIFESTGPLKGVVSVPGDKSISHRAALLSALSEGICGLTGYSPAEDCERTLGALEALGAAVHREGTKVTIEGKGREGFTHPREPIFAGNSGTTMRLLAGVLAPSSVTAEITGDSSLLDRPMDRIITPLKMMGAHVRASDERGHPPLYIEGRSLHGIDYEPPVASAQVKSAVLLAGLGADGRTSVKEIVLTRDHTERMLKLTGIAVEREGMKVTITPGEPEPRDMDIPGDFSSAAFLVAGAVLCPGSDVLIKDVGLNPTRTAFLQFVKRMGANVEAEVGDDDGWEPRGSLRARHGRLRSIKLDADDVALAIDEIPLIALLGCFAEGRTEISGASELRYKESDRIRKTVEALGAMGARIEETPDGIAVEGPCALRSASVSAGKDHRMAMMLAVAGLAVEGKMVVDGWEWTKVSYPGFAEVLKSLTTGSC